MATKSNDTKQLTAAFFMDLSKRTLIFNYENGGNQYCCRVQGQIIADENFFYK